MAADAEFLKEEIYNDVFLLSDGDGNTEEHAQDEEDPSEFLGPGHGNLEHVAEEDLAARGQEHPDEADHGDHHERFVEHAQVCILGRVGHRTLSRWHVGQKIRLCSSPSSSFPRSRREKEEVRETTTHASVECSTCISRCRREDPAGTYPKQTFEQWEPQSFGMRRRRA